MNQGQYVFSQLTAFLSHNEFNRCVKKYEGNYKVKTLTCWHQFLYMMFGQLARRESLSDLIICLQSQANKSYHLGMGKGSSKAALAKANENRAYRIYEFFATELILQAQRMSINMEELKLSIESPVYAIDATVIDLCLSVFWWGKFRKHKAAAKIHAMLDVKTNVPTFIDITSGAVHEVNVLDIISFEAGSYYTMDKAFIDFARLYFIHKCDAFYVIRAKDNFQFVRIKSSPVDKSTGIICDQVVRLKNQKVSMFYPEHIRRIKYYDSEKQTELVFITNDFEIDATDVARIYKYRWTI